ncbi:hypothetical protein FOCC_FOCC013159 [Frankliniella occidentalis]|nr:hypothetical protein FOCC_FOCC013159 [Frankliniella occidentalis]
MPFSYSINPDSHRLVARTSHRSKHHQGKRTSEIEPDITLKRLSESRSGLVRASDRPHNQALHRKVTRKKAQEKAVAENSNKNIRGLYFDGKTDSTITHDKSGATYHTATISEEHISLVEEPGGQYLGHLSSGKSAHASSKAILEYCNQNKISLDELEVIGCDGTATNTGHLGGIITLLENHLNRSVQWMVCLLHFNELPLRHLIIDLDGNTTGPKAFSGPIGKQLKACENMPVVHFTVIEADFPSVDANVLSTDQQYLYNMCLAVSSGEVPDSLAKMKPGPLNHARWLTAACRILRLYVATASPSRNLKHIAEFIIKVYAPVWFAVKVDCKFYNASLHVWRKIRLSRYLPKKLKAIVDPVIERNAFALHPENLLVTMLRDTRQQVRQRSVTMLLKARQADQKNLGVRVRDYRPPKINFDAQDYPDLIDWKQVKVTFPPVLRRFTNSDLEQAVNNPDFLEENLPPFPCHTQAVERTVQLVSKASKKVTGQDGRDGAYRKGNDELTYEYNYVGENVVIATVKIKRS